MGLFENFPYTNFHNLNLDWIIKVLKNAVAELEEIQTNWESVRDTANTAKTTADAAATKAENARITANGAMTKADAAKTQSENAELAANAARVASEDAQTTAHESDEKAARAEIVAGAAQSTANAAKKTADGVDAKATTALENSTNAVTTADAAKTTADGVDGKATNALSNSTEAVTTANAAKTTAEGANEKATTADSKVDTLTTTVNSVGKTASDALSLAQTNETDIASNDADIAEIRKFVTAPNETLMQPGGYFVVSAGDTNYNIPESTDPTAVYTQIIPITISDDTVNTLAELESATDGDGHLLYRVNYVPRVWLNVGDSRNTIPAVAVRSSRNTLLIAATSNIAYNATDGALHYTLAIVCDLVGINQYISTPT